MLPICQFILLLTTVAKKKKYIICLSTPKRFVLLGFFVWLVWLWVFLVFFLVFLLCFGLLVWVGFVCLFYIPALNKVCCKIFMLMHGIIDLTFLKQINLFLLISEIQLYAVLGIVTDVICSWNRNAHFGR